MTTGAIDTVNRNSSPEVQMNEAFVALKPAGLFGARGSTTAGLTFGYYGGIMGTIGNFTTVPDGTIALTASTTNYIEADTAGAVSKNTSGFTAGRTPLYTAVTNGSGITTLSDYRQGGALVGTTVTLPGTLAVTKSVDLSEMTAPTGVANTARLFAVDNGSGKTVLKVIFGSGAAQQISIEP